MELSLEIKPHKWSYAKYFNMNRGIGGLYFPTLLYASWGQECDFVIHYCVLKAPSTFFFAHDLLIDIQ